MIGVADGSRIAGWLRAASAALEEARETSAVLAALGAVARAHDGARSTAIVRSVRARLGAAVRGSSSHRWLVADTGRRDVTVGLRDAVTVRPLLAAVDAAGRVLDPAREASLAVRAVAAVAAGAGRAAGSSRSVGMVARLSAVPSGGDEDGAGDGEPAERETE